MVSQGCKVCKKEHDYTEGDFVHSAFFLKIEWCYSIENYSQIVKSDAHLHVINTFSLINRTKKRFIYQMSFSLMRFLCLMNILLTILNQCRKNVNVILISLCT